MRTAADPGRLVLVAGSAGSGKTRLVQELHEATDTTVLTGHCPPRAEPFPLAPVIEALRGAPIPDGLSPLCGALHALMPEHGDRLPAPLPPATTPADDQHRTYRAFTELLGALGPAVLVVEDVQWIDQTTRDLLHYLTPRLPPTLSLVLTYRPEELPRSFPVAALAALAPATTTHDELTLDPLTPQDLLTLAHGFTATATAEDAHRLHAWTGGQPLAAVETLRHLATLTPTEPAIPAQPPVPAALRDWWIHRLRALDRDTRRLLRAAAVLDTPSNETHLARVADLSPHRAEKALARACRRGLLHTTDPTTLTTATPLLRQVCYTALPRDKRRRLHRAALAVLSQTPDPDHARLAHHAREAGLLDAWTNHAEHAADLALAQGEDTTAVTLLRDALTRRSLPPRRRCELTLKLGRAALTGISAEHTIALLRDVLTTPGLSAAERGELRMELGLLLLNQAAQGRTARGELVRATAELSTRPDLAARAMCALAVPRDTSDSVDTHRRWMEQAVAAADRSRDPAVNQIVAVNHATLLAQIGDPDAWTVTLPDPGTAHAQPTPQTLARRREFARGSLNLADAAVMLGHYDRADHHLDDATSWSVAADAPYVHESAHTLRLLLDWVRGRWPGLAEETERNLRSPRLAHLHSVTAELTVIRAGLALAQGDPATAQTHLARVRPGPEATARTAPDYTVPVRALAAGLLARLATAQGDPATAWEHVDDLVSLVASKGIWVWAAELVPGMEALLDTGRVAVARDLCARFSAGLRGAHAPAAEAALIRFKAAIAHHRGHHDRALHLYGEAENAYRAMGRPYDAAQARESAAHALLSQTDGHDRAPSSGVGDLRSALAEYTELGAAWDASRVRRALRAHGVVTPPTTGRGRGDRRLSPRESEIATLAAQGRTNREIAALLHLSPRTVETHVANALAKLGLRSRRDLSAPSDPSAT
ncbi:AAA family ATPase [Nocardiopsis sp. EMB25]|nr:AAA family ATPase [Nocardiopsis sp. EMB25]